MRSYSSFARFYDSLTENVEYEKRADYICTLFKKLNHNMGLSLDLACGTGSLTIELAKRGIDIYGIDASEEMLTEALDKAYDAQKSIMFLCQKMQTIDLYGTIDTCICTLDSINHLTNPQDVQKTFNKVSLFMNPGGYFLFDVNTVYKHQKVLADNNFVIENENVFCVWQNYLQDNNIVEINMDFFVESENNFYKRFSESFCERAYTEDELRTMLGIAGFKIISRYGDLSFEPPKAEEERVIYVVQKI